VHARLTAKDEIKDLYWPFKIISKDRVDRSDGNGKYIIKEWLITGAKEYTSFTLHGWDHFG
jgi:hypothetical protein